MLLSCTPDLANPEGELQQYYCKSSPVAGWLTWLDCCIGQTASPLDITIFDCTGFPDCCKSIAPILAGQKGKC